jgi:hypothetical protein
VRFGGSELTPTTRFLVLALVGDSDARRTHFRKPLEFDRDKITDIETELAKLISGGALVRAGETEVVLTEEWVD